MSKIKAKPYLIDVSYRKEAISAPDIYPFNIPFLRKFEKMEFDEDVTIIVGENGSGKSTLIEAIATNLGLSSEGGTKNFNINTANDISALSNFLQLGKSYKKPTDYYFLRAESFYNVATFMDNLGGAQRNGYGNKNLNQQSHGEAFFAVLKHKLSGKGLYIFDEPESALSPSRQLSALAMIQQLVQKESQFIIATHSPILMAYPNAKILMIGEEGVEEVQFEDTEHYRIYKRFFSDYKSLVNQILEVNK